MRRRSLLAGWLLALAVALTSVALTAQQGGEPPDASAAEAEADAAPVALEQPQDAGSPADGGRSGAPAPAGPPVAADAGADATAAHGGDPWEPLGEPLATCVRAFRTAQKLRRTGKLRACLDELVVCARAQCPSVLADKCMQWHREVTAAVPSVVVAATDPDGRDTLQVRVIVDGRPAAARLEGRPLPLDPGAHVLRFEHRGSPVIRQRIVLHEGEKSRRIELAFSRTPMGWTAPQLPPAEEPADEAPSATMPVAYTAFGLSGLGLVVGVVTGIVALDELAAIEESCPNEVCPTELQDDFDRAATVANVSTAGFVVAGVGAVVGLGAVVASVVSEDDEPADRGADRVRVEARLGAGVATLWGAF